METMKWNSIVSKRSIKKIYWKLTIYRSGNSVFSLYYFKENRGLENLFFYVLRRYILYLFPAFYKELIKKRVIRIDAWI